MLTTSRMSALSAPVLMVGALVVAMLLAVGHHLYYTSLAGTQAATGHYRIGSANVSEQQFNIAVGTTFATLVKASLTLAVSIAYTQAFWRAAKRTDKGRRLSTLDTMYSALANILAFLHVRTWFNYPLLLALAVIVWLIPTASIVTPATLSVQSAPVSPVRSENTTVPQLGLVSLNYLAAMPVGRGLEASNDYGNVSQYCYTGPSLTTDRLVNAVGAQGGIIDLPFSAPNASWELDLWMPTLTCSEIDGLSPLGQQIRANIYSQLAYDCYDNPALFAWTPTEKYLGPYSYDNSTKETSIGSTYLTTQGKFYIQTMPNAWRGSFNMGSHDMLGSCAAFHGNSLGYYAEWPRDGSGNEMFIEGSQSIECVFRNTSQALGFSIVNGRRSIEVKNQRKMEEIEPVGCVMGPRSTSNGRGDGTAGTEEAADAGCSTLNVEGTQCLFDPAVARRLSYQAIADAFFGLVRGDIQLAADGVSYSSQINKTVLLETDELLQIPRGSVVMDYDDLQNRVSLNNGTALKGLVKQQHNGSSRGPLRTVLEDLFTNFTLSLMSEPSLWPDYTSPFAPQEQVNVTYPTFHNIYAYDRKALWIAYATAIAFSLLAVGAGVAIFCLNGASYDDSFSAILRVGRTATFHEPAGRKDVNASRVVIGDDDTGESRREEKELTVVSTEQEPSGSVQPSAKANDALLGGKVSPGHR